MEVARCAPSPHNTQPWKLRIVGGTEAELFIQKSRMLPDEDTTGCFIRCAMGIFTEALAIAAGEAGWALHARWSQGPEAGGLIPFANLRLEPGGSPAYPVALLRARRTSRLNPGAKKVPAADLERVASVAAAGGQRFTCTDDGSLIGRILKKNVEAAIEDLSDRKYREEIRGWFRYSGAQAARTRDGLAAACMNVPAHEMYMSAHFPWLLRAPVCGRVMRALYQLRIGGAGQMGFLSGEFFEPVAAAEAGRCLLRVWLELTRIGAWIHPFGNLVTNAGAHRWLTDATGTEGIWLVFRLGYTAPPPASHRLGAEDLLC